MLGPPVGGIDLGPGEEGAQGGGFVDEVFDQLAALVVSLGLVTEQLDSFS